ncbi:MAG: hypothetical protein LBU65_00890, partial [Planctomycetaceae bacterium]|nr:hypothetical protein [Planctomycetaceae bacterium]
MQKNFILNILTVLLVLFAVNSVAEVTAVSGGVVAHRGLTFTQAQAIGLLKLYRDPSYKEFIRRNKYEFLHSLTPNERALLLYQVFYLRMIGDGNVESLALQYGSLLGGSHGVASMLSVLTLEPVQSMLELDKTQIREIHRLAGNFPRSVTEQMQTFRRDNPNATAEQTAIARLGAAERLGVPLRDSLGKLLSAQQLQFLREIVFLLYGGLETPVVDLEILTLFNLTKEQRDSLDKIAEDANQRRADATSGRQPESLTPDDFIV